MDAREFQEWNEYYKIEPWGDDWLQTGTIAAATVNTWSKRKVKPERFIPRARASKDLGQLEGQMNHWARMHNAQIERKQKGAQ